jgi:hypothetical protein
MTENELNERLSRRFGSDEEAKRDSSEQISQTSQNDNKVQNIKKEWNVRSIYLPDTLNEELTTTFKRLDFKISEKSEFEEFKKTRHFYPLIVTLGLDRLEGMDIQEITERLERNDFKECKDSETDAETE